MFLRAKKPRNEGIRARKQPVIILSRCGCSICRRASASSPASPPRQLGNSLASLPLHVLTPLEQANRGILDPWGGGRSTRGCNSETFSRSSVIFRYFTECFHGNVGELLSTRDGGNSETNDAILETVDGYFRRVSFYRAYRGFDVH